MTLVQFYPATGFDCLFEDALAARLCPRASAPETKHTASHQRNAHRPRLDLYESTDDNTVTATFELPGLTPEKVAIDVHQNRLTVSGETSDLETKEENNYVVRERRSGKFSRTLQLPFGTKPEDIRAKMENGILTVTYPKTSPEQQAKRVVIQ